MCRVCFVTNLYLILICGVFISGNTYSLDCDDLWKDSDRSAQRENNERLLRSFQGDTGQLFFQNFMDGNLGGENNFIAIKGTSSVGRILKKIDDRRILIETVNSSGELEEIEITVKIGTDASGERPFMFIQNSPFKPFRGGSSFIINQGHPQLEFIFQAHRSTLKRVDSRVLNLPEQNNKEKKLRGQRYSSAYVRGIDEAEIRIAVAERLRELVPHPYKTDLDYLRSQIRDHIEHIRKKITNPRQAKALEELKREAKPKIKGKEAVTYAWWVEFNFSLSKALYPEISKSEVRRAEERNRIQALINQFPFNILVPTTIGVVGVMFINETYPEGVLPAGLLNEKKDVDGLTDLPPEGHYLHDIGHAENFMDKVRNTYAGLAYKRFHDKLTEKKQNLPPQDRQKVEFGYYMMGHESFSQVVYSSLESIRESLQSILQFQIGERFNFKGLVDFFDDFDRRDKQVHDIAKDFAEFSAPLTENP